jgi:hypothetical protein
MWLRWVSKPIESSQLRSTIYVIEQRSEAKLFAIAAAAPAAVTDAIAVTAAVSAFATQLEYSIAVDLQSYNSLVHCTSYCIEILLFSKYAQAL